MKKILDANQTDDEEQFVYDDKYKFFYYSRLNKNVATKFITENNKYILMNYSTHALFDIAAEWAKQENFKIIYAASPNVLKENSLNFIKAYAENLFDQLGSYCLTMESQKEYTAFMEKLIRHQEILEIACEILKEPKPKILGSFLKDLLWNDKKRIEEYYMQHAKINVYNIEKHLYDELRDASTSPERLDEFLIDGKQLFDVNMLALRNPNVNPKKLWRYAATHPFIVANNPSAILDLIENPSDAKNLLLQLFSYYG